jgi:acetyl esterase
VTLTGRAAELAARLAERSRGVGESITDAVVARELGNASVRAPGPALGVVEDIAVERTGLPAVRTRLYCYAATSRAPLLLFFHGGGWVVGDLDSHDRVCRHIAAEAGCAVLAVDYRLAPEHPYPAALEDAYAVLAWAAGQALPFEVSAIGVTGDSAGANLATVLCMLARDRGGPEIAAQLLVCPIADADFETASYREFAEGGGVLTLARMRWYWAQYAAGHEPTAPYLSPLRAAAHGLPPALVMVAGHDPLRDEGVAYAAHLRDAGVAVRLRHYEQAFHGFYGFYDELEIAAEAHRETARWLRAHLG